MSVQKSAESFRDFGSNSRRAMTASSGKKYPLFKIREPVSEYSNHETMENGMNHMGNPRSLGKKYQPVRISTAHFDNPPGFLNLGSSRKTMHLSSRKPIRNIHKLLESPKRNARKRLDNLYDCSKPKENVNSITAKAQVLSAKKLTIKTSNTIVTSNNASNTKTGLTTSKQSQNSRLSKLLPPGTITDSYVNKRNSLGPKTSISKPVKNRLMLAQKNSHSKRPSNVPEESPQLLETSDNSFDKGKELQSMNRTANKSIEDVKEVESNNLNNICKETSPQIDDRDEKKKSMYCCQCFRDINGSNASENVSKLPDTSIKNDKNSKEIDKQDLGDGNKAEHTLQRPTVIVMQKEIAPQSNTEDLNESVDIPVQDGSYSEILNLQPSANCTQANESLLFKHIESTCNRSEKIKELNDSDERTDESVFKLMNANTEMLVMRQKHLIEFISRYEENITSMKMMLEDVNAQLNEQKILESTIKLKRSSSLNNTELFKLTFPYVDEDRTDNLKTPAAPRVASKNCDTSSKENFESSRKTNSPDATEQRKTLKSIDVKSQSKEKRNNLSENVSSDSNKGDSEIENIENKPPQRRRSARLALKNADLSSPIMRNTPVSSKIKTKFSQAKSKPCTPSMTTPAQSVKWARRSERPLREYMVLKSAIKFLNTPDSRRYKIGSDEKVKIRDSLDKTDQVLLTDKLLKELHDLYATP